MELAEKRLSTKSWFPDTPGLELSRLEKWPEYDILARMTAVTYCDVFLGFIISLMIKCSSMNAVLQYRTNN